MQEEWYWDKDRGLFFYRADKDEDGTIPYLHSGEGGWGGGVMGAVIDDWQPAKIMPPEAARTWLEITEIRTQRIRDISEKDVREEGVEHYNDEGVTYFGPLNHGTVRYDQAFKNLIWDSLYPGSWERNDWVWVLTFKVVEGKGGNK